MKILIVGNGFIGSKLTEKLERLDHEVTTLDRSNGDIKQDITKDFEIDKHFDVVFHTVGLAPGLYRDEKYREIDVKGTENLLDAVDTDKFVYISALKADSGENGFFKSKKEAELLVQNSGFDYTIVRPSTVYGEGNKLMEWIKNIAPLRVFPRIETETQPITIENLVEILEKTVTEFDNQVLNVAGPEKYKAYELAKIIYGQNGFNCLIIPAPRFLQVFGAKAMSIAPFMGEDLVSLLEHQNTTEDNDAEKIIDLDKVFYREIDVD